MLAKTVYQTQMMFIFQFILLACVIYEMYDHRKSYIPVPSSIELYMAKFVTSIAMHLSIYTEF